MTRSGLIIFLVACGGADRAPATPATPAASHAAAPPASAAAEAPAEAASHAAAPPASAAAEAPAEAAGSGADAADASRGGADAEEDETKILDLESIGPLRFSSSGAQLVKHLGAPKKKSPPGLEEAYGAYVSAWSWPGVSVIMVAGKPTGPWLARTIQVSAPIKLATKAGIRIGSSRKEVEAKYKRGSMDQGDPGSFLVGSPYGGMYFTFKNDVVTEIGIGAFAF